MWCVWCGVVLCGKPRMRCRVLKCGLVTVYCHGFCLFCFFESYKHPYSAHAGHIGKDRSLLMGHDALIVRQIARVLLHALSHIHYYTWTAFVETAGTS